MKAWTIIGAILLILSLAGVVFLGTSLPYETAKVAELEAEVSQLKAEVSQLENEKVMWENEVMRITEDWRVIERGAKIAQEFDRYDGLIELIYQLAPPVRPLIKTVP